MFYHKLVKLEQKRMILATLNLEIFDNNVVYYVNHF